MDPVVVQKIRKAFDQSGLKLHEVCDHLIRSGARFRPDVPALSRALRGHRALTFVECQDLALVFGLELRWSLRKAAA